ncbi:MAG: NAD-dependent epimerase/dehydratase family protein [Candidatus Caenarcaniphilales bacterium]|nr:NAD-dependent epimerase/dehydratase family protein [Candidatus Caenarcaniphilales bacterium]
MKLLITGATGYLAANFINHCLAENIFLDQFKSITLLDRTIKQNRLVHLNDNFVFITGDLQAAPEDHYDCVLHFAYAKDIQAEKNFLLKYKNSYLIFASSAAVYGNQDNLPISPSAKPMPISDYGRYKLELEEFIQANFAKYLIVRIANPFGKEFAESKSFNTIVASRLETGDNVEIELNADEPQELVRDFVPIRDFCEQIVNAFGKAGILNVSSGKGLTLETFVQMLNQLKYSGLKKIKFNYKGKNNNEIIKSILKPYEVYSPENSLK